jgi:hypothetical protein
MTHEGFERPLWRRLLLNRFVAALAVLTAAAGLWNGYVFEHGHGSSPAAWSTPPDTR